MWNPFKKEERETLEEILLRSGALTQDISKDQALSVPAVSACVSLICDTIANLPIVLYKQSEGETEVVENDPRVALLNDDTNDTLDGFQFKRSLCEDFLLEGGGYAYIERQRNSIKSLHYIEHQRLNAIIGADPIYKNYQIQVNGATYRDFQFLKLLRKTRNGVTGTGILRESNKMLAVAYNSIVYENTLMTTGGNRKGFLKSAGRLSEMAMNELKRGWKDLYANNSDSNVLILNNGLDFQESSLSSVDMQLNEQKMTNSAEIGKIFLVPANILDGTATDSEYMNWIKMCISPILTAFETALNRDLLLPSEKETHYWAFDLSETLKGDVVSRYTAYELGIKSGVLQIDEVRFKENLPPLGLKWLKLGLQDVLYFPESDEIYTPNTNKLAKMGEDGTPEDNMGEVNPNDPNQPQNKTVEPKTEEEE
jgi:HK97 family phage portal protein